jgi:hypothetical protein
MADVNAAPNLAPLLYSVEIPTGGHAYLRPHILLLNR